MKAFIEREMAIEFVKKAWAKGLNVVEYLEEVPAADVVEVRHGRWMAHHIEPDDFKNDYDVPYDEKDPEQWGCYCSECGIDALLNGNEKKVASDYCPNCGAKMDGGADDA